MKIEMFDGGESPDLGAFKAGDIVEVKDKTGETLIARGLAREFEKVESKKKGGKENGGN